MHVWTHLKDSVKGKTGLGVFSDGMVEHDRQVGELLDKLDELGIADNTIVWAHGASTSFASSCVKPSSS